MLYTFRIQILFYSQFWCDIGVVQLIMLPAGRPYFVSGA